MSLFYGPTRPHFYLFIFYFFNNFDISAIFCPIFKRFSPFYKKCSKDYPPKKNSKKKKRIPGRPGGYFQSHPVYRKQTFFLVLPKVRFIIVPGGLILCDSCHRRLHPGCCHQMANSSVKNYCSCCHREGASLLCPLCEVTDGKSVDVRFRPRYSLEGGGEILRPFDVCWFPERKTSVALYILGYRLIIPHTDFVDMYGRCV